MTLLPTASNGVTQTWSPQAGMFSGGVATFPIPSQTADSVQTRVWPAAYSRYEDAGPSFELGRGKIQKITLGGPGTPQSLLAPTGAGDMPFVPFRVGDSLATYEPLHFVPRLDIQNLTNGSLQLSWQGQSGLVLQEAVTIQTNPIIWANASFPYVNNKVFGSATIPASTSNRYFRLIFLATLVGLT
jgi:hypothetical protein